MAKAVYFPGLNTVRLYAALCVVFLHSATMFGASSYDWVMSGTNSVTLFFVLSGFLITYLLLDEKQRIGTVEVTAFYTRRALRIMPLYYLIVFIGYAIPLFVSQLWTLPYSLFFLVAIPHAHAPLSLPYIGHLYTIGVEEVFYFAIPILLKRFAPLKIFLSIIVVRLLVMLLIAPALDTATQSILEFYRFECMAVGGLATWLYREHRSALRVVYHPIVAWLSFALIILLHFNKFDVDPLTISIIFVVFLLNIATNRRFPSFEHRWLSWWGQRTYGIYMWHFLMIGIVQTAIPGVPWELGLFLTLVMTLVVSALSYRWFEKPFLRLKKQRRVIEPVTAAA